MSLWFVAQPIPLKNVGFTHTALFATPAILIFAVSIEINETNLK